MMWRTIRRVVPPFLGSVAYYVGMAVAFVVMLFAYLAMAGVGVWMLWHFIKLVWGLL